MKKILFLLPLILALLVSGTVEAKKKKYPNEDYYEGKWKKGNPNGIGIMKYANGNIYEGNWVEGKSSGEGVMRYANGDTYKGYWLEGKFSGQGIMKYKNGNTYNGNWIEGQISGKGIMKYANGDIYDGNWTNGKMYGQGTMKYANGDLYEGNWISDQPGENGTMKYKNGTICTGTWVLGKFTSGTSNGEIPGKGYYNGEWKYGKFYNGQSKEIINGNYYEGEWTNGSISGKGLMRYTNGNVYDGEWRDGQYNGHGVMKYSNGDVYDGNWILGKIYGSGVMKYANGDNYNGEWNSNEPDGNGIMKYRNGTVCNGTWSVGTFQTGTSNGEIPGDGYYNGEWLDGNFYNGTCKGYIDSEIWFDGEIHNGNLKNGKIEFSTLKGNWANSIFNGKLSLDNIDYTCKIINEESSNNYLVTIYLKNKVYNTFKANNISINDLFNQLYSEIENKNKLVKQEFYNKYLKEKFFGIEGKYDDIYKSSLLSSFTLAPALDIMSGIFFTSENKLTKMRAANINKNRLNRMLGNMSYNESRGHMLQLLGIVEELNKVEELEYKIINGYLVFGKYKYKIINNNRALYDEEDKKTYPVLSEDKVMKFIKAMGYKGE